MNLKPISDDFVWGAKDRDFNIQQWIEKYYDGQPDETDLMQQCTGLCGCGSGEDYKLLIEVLRWCAQEHDKKDKEGCYKSAAWELAAKVLDDARLIEHGSGIGWPWITDWGKEVLKYIDILKASKPEDEC